MGIIGMNVVMPPQVSKTAAKLGYSGAGVVVALPS